MITVDVDFQERSVKITQDDLALNNTIMHAHNLDGNRTRVTTEIGGLDWHDDRRDITLHLASYTPNGSIKLVTRIDITSLSSTLIMVRGVPGSIS